MKKADIPAVMAEALEVLRRGGVILYPTDTIWGIGCDATDPDAVRRVYEIKRRSDSKSLVLLASDLDMVARYITKIPDVAIDLVEVNDKPMTIIYPGAVCSQVPAEGESAPKDRWHLAWNTVAEDGSVGIRIPMMDFCKELVRRLGRPLVSTSANISGEPSPKTFKDIPEEIRSAVDYIVSPSMDRESTGLASQIIKLEVDGEVKIIRP
jgi:L-threonylcarbamoyladenylate synthase